MPPLAFKPRTNVLSFHLISLTVRRSQTYPLMSWELWCSWRTMWNTQNCHGRLANFHFNIASSHVLTMVWITRVYVTCSCYESLMSACNFVCTWSYRIMYFSLFQGGRSTCTQFHSWWIQDNTVKIWMKHFKKRSCLCCLCLFASLHCSLHRFSLVMSGGLKLLFPSIVALLFFSYLESCHCDTTTLKV